MNSSSSGFKWEGAKITPLLSLIVIFLVLWYLPPPTGLTVKAWHLFTIFITTILSLILKPLPMGAMSLIAVSVCLMTKTIPMGQVLASFSSGIVWLIVSAFLLARGFIKTGLGSRIAYHFVSMLGKNTLGLAYGLTFTELVFAPGTPSNTARGAGIVYPIIMGLNKEYGSDPKDGTERKLGSYLIKLLFQVNVITSAMFLTATAGNPLLVSIAADQGVELSWGVWAMACIVPGLANLILLPLIMFVINPPELRSTPEAPGFARQKLKELGPMNLHEIMMMMVFLLLLCLWVFGTYLGVDATAAALSGLCLLLISGVLKWDDVIKEKSAWDTFIWMAVLIMLSTQLAKCGITGWFGTHMQAAVGSLHWTAVLIIISLVYLYTHYFFASMTAHISALFGTFLTVCLAAGTPPMPTVLFLGVASSLCAGITHYGTGAAPVYFGSNYLKVGSWWRIGGIVSVCNVVIWGVIGGLWWKILGYW